jgi:hypothetical protein
MVPIALKADKQFDEEEFKEHLLKLCNHHKKQKRALAFAFIVYDFDDQAINQILKHKDYWSNLDKISGKFLSVFYINSRDSYYKMRQKQIYNEEIQAAINSRESNICFRIRNTHFLIPLTPKPTPLDNAIGFIKKEFKLDDNLKHPFVLFFQTDGEDISDFFIVTLKQEKLEEAFFELRDHIKNAVDSLSEVKPEYIDNYQEIFDLIRSGVKDAKFNDFVKKKVVPKLSIREIISLIKLISGGG